MDRGELIKDAISHPLASCPHDDSLSQFSSRLSKAIPVQWLLAPLVQLSHTCRKIR